MIRKENSVFILDTLHTTYCFRVMETGHLEHLYYGKKITLKKTEDADVLFEKQKFPPGNTIIYDKEHNSLALEDVRLEMSSYGKGDIREPFVEIMNRDGSFTSDFLYETYEIKQGKKLLETLPSSYDDKNEAMQLVLTLKDKNYDLTLKLSYSVFEECDVITRSAELINESENIIKLNRLMSTQLDFDTADFVMTTFHGAWAREMNETSIPLRMGKHINASYTGTSSSRANPFVMLGKCDTTQDIGECYGINLVYSGNHYEAAEVSSFGKTRFVAGINPTSFCYVLKPEESFETPEAVMTYSHLGYNGMSRHMHDFVREHIVRGEWKNKVRPVLLNSWEAAYFDINEGKLLNLAKAGKDVGIELFVMDDGWFGERDDDTSSLGDWDENKKKLPGGIKRLCDKIRKMGLMFGIWVEPEMVNVKSKLFNEHPDWVLAIPENPHSEGRNQRILDLTQKEVQDYIIEKMTEVFSSAEISYVKWDMNRIFSDYYSPCLGAENQGEAAHRYVLGLYRCMKELTYRFPGILFEGCAAGGNRFDLGILSYFPQIWASDNTDAMCRCDIQNGYSYAYPPSVITAHVSSCPNHQTLRVTPIETRFNVACFGILGYECNFCDMKNEDLNKVKEQISLYKKWREVLQFGTFFRGRSFSDKDRYGSTLWQGTDNCMEWTMVSKDGSKAVGILVQKLAVPNARFHTYMAKGLKEDARYHFYNRELKYDIRPFGDLVNTVSPIHIKQDSLTHNVIAKFVKMDGEKEEYYAYGDVLMHGGVRLKQAFAGTGYDGEVRYFQDFGSRIYFMEEEMGGLNEQNQ